MHADQPLRRLGKRLALATCTGVVIAAALAGPAMADPGALLFGVAESLPPVVAEPVEDVGSTAEQLVEQVQAPVDAVVEDATGLVDETVSGVQETVVDGTLGAVEETVPTVAVSPSDPDVAAPTAVRTEQGSTPETVPTTTAVVSPDVSQSGSTLATVGTERVLAPNARSGATRSRSSDPTLPVVSTESIESTAIATAAVTVTREESPAASARPRDGANASPPTQPSFFADPSIFGGSVPQPPAPALLIALLLGLLALAAPRAGGPRVHPAVALPHPADVRFRLVRPG
jgi:hypothetical protein